MAISIQPLINQTNGKHVEVAGGPKFQCTDLVNYWLRMLGRSLILGRNAIDFRTAPGYTYVANTPSFVPQEGDIAIFGFKPYGDVAVVAPGTDVNNLVVYGQNYPIGGVCRTRTHRSYAGVLGFLTLSSARKSNSQIAREVLDGKWGNGADRRSRLEKAGYNYAAVQAEVNKLLK